VNIGLENIIDGEENARLPLACVNGKREGVNALFST
jgi:hypothetical protein